MKWFLAIGTAALVCWGGAAPPASAQQIVETRPIDQTFHVITVRRENRPTGVYMVYNYIKAEQRDGQLMICGGYTGELTAVTSLTYSDALRNHDTYLVVGTRDDASAPRISPLGFMTANVSASPRLEDMKAACIVTGYSWDPKYATSRFQMSTGNGRGY
jgi:hypothetical protein